jgi:hypothetical protein
MRWDFLTVTLMVGLSAYLDAQTPGDIASREASVEALRTGAWVRVAAAPLGRIEGRVVAHTATELVLSVEEGPSRIPLAGVDTLWVRGKATRTGALVGGLLGTGLGILIATQAVEEGETPGADWVGAFGLGGALVGGSLGAALGSAFPRWDRRYPP